MDDLLKELEAVALLAEKATPGPFVVDTYGDVQANGEDVARIASSGDLANNDARVVAAAVNFLRTHHAEIAEAVRDARRYRWLRNIAWSIPSIAQQELPAVAVFSGTGRRCKDISGAEMDQAIDAAIVITQGSVQEGGN